MEEKKGEEILRFSKRKNGKGKGRTVMAEGIKKEDKRQNNETGVSSE